MIKKLIRVVIALALCALAYWAYLQFQRWQSFRIEIPRQADRVIRLNIEQLGKKLLLTDKQEASKDPLLARLFDAFELPPNVFAFGIKSVSSNVFFMKLGIQDKQQFDAVLDELFLSGQDSLRSNKSGTISVLFNSNEAVLILGKDTGQRIYDLAKDYLNEKGTIPFSDSKLYEIKSRKADLSAWGNMYHFELNFDAGRFHGEIVNNVLPSELAALTVPGNAALAILSKENMFNLLGKWGIRELLPGLPLSELSPLAAPGFACYIDGEFPYAHEVLDYEYNEDFIKREKTSIQVLSMPQLTIKLPLAHKNALTSLKAKGLLMGADSVNNEVLPLIPLRYLLKTNGVLMMQANAAQDTTIAEPVKLCDKAAMMAWADFERLAAMESFRDFKPYLEKLKRLDIKHQRGETYQFELRFTDTHTNALRQLLRLVLSSSKANFN